jgi:hypothetical protein
MNTQLLHLLAGSQPVLLVGCHRSGTTFLAELCDGAGLFLGSDLFEQHESNHFMQLHDQLLALAGARWNQPGPLLERIADDPAFAETLVTEIIRNMLRTEFFHRFHGYRSYLGRRLGRQWAWGWKDPRTSLFLSHYLRIFPRCAVLHICRNGIDVAASLVQRDLVEESCDKTPEDATRRIETAFELWTRYEQSVLDAVEASGHGNYLRIRFEDLVQGEEATISRLSGFLSRLGLARPELGNRQPTMAWKFTRSEQLSTFYLQHRHDALMAQYGYDTILPD